MSPAVLLLFLCVHQGLMGDLSSWPCINQVNTPQGAVGGKHSNGSSKNKEHPEFILDSLGIGELDFCSYVSDDDGPTCPDLYCRGEE